MAMPRIILLMLVLNTAIALGGLAFNYSMLKTLQAGGGVANGEPSEGRTEAEAEEASEYTFFPIEKVIVSLPGKGREHYFVLDLVLQAELDTDRKKLEQVDPMVRNSVVAHLSTLSFDQLRGLPITELQGTLEKVLLDDFASKKVAVPFVHVLVSKLIVQ